MLQLDDIDKELALITLRLTEIDLHLQMIDRNIERLVQLALRINGQLPEPETEAAR